MEKQRNKRSDPLFSTASKAVTFGQYDAKDAMVNVNKALQDQGELMLAVKTKTKDLTEKIKGMASD